LPVETFLAESFDGKVPIRMLWISGGRAMR
jgi:hypothetical protein